MSSNFLAAVTIIIWGTMPAIIKDLLKGLPCFEVLAISSAFAFVFLLAMNYRIGILKKFNYLPPKNIFEMASLGFLGLFLYSAFYYYGLSQLSSQEACILNYLWPIMIVIFSAPILGEKITPRKIFAILLSFGGIVLIVLGNATENISGSNTFAGAVSCVVAAACYGLFSVLNKRRRLNQNLTMMIIWLTTAVCSFLAGGIFETWTAINFRQLLGLIWLGVATDAVAYLTWALALERAHDTAQVANLAYLTPLLAIFVSTFAFDEELSPMALPALILILSGIFFQKRE